MRSYYLLSELARNNSVDLIALNQEKLLSSYFNSLQEGVEVSHEVLSKKLNSVNIVKFNTRNSRISKFFLAIRSLFSSIPYSITWLKSSELEQILKKYLKNVNYDIIHFDTIGLAIYYKYLGKSTICSLDHHNIESHMMLRRSKKEKNFLKKFYFWQESLKLYKYEQNMLKYFHAHITCSEIDKIRLQAIDQEINIETIPNPVEVPDLVNNIEILDNKPPTLLFIGGLDWYPNTDAVLHFCEEILPDLKNIFPSIIFNIIGKNPPKRLIKLAKINPSIKLHGFVNSIKPFYESCDLYMCPIRDGGGTKLKVLDAMIHALPIIGYPETFEGLEVVNEEHCFICTDKKVLLSKTTELLSDKSKLSSIGQKAHSLVKNLYSVDVVGEKLNKYYTKIVNKI